jgi:hypothetical protein
LEQFHSLNLAKSAEVTMIRKDDWSRAEVLQDKPLGANAWLIEAGKGGSANKPDIFDYFEEEVAPSLATAIRDMHVRGLSGVDVASEARA